MRFTKIPFAIYDHANRLLLRKKAPQQFTIISNNCWGAGFYKDLGRAYNTPFVGTMVPPECYLKLLANFPKSLAQPLRFISKSRYTFWDGRWPVATLGDSEIHFMHYSSEEEALKKWQRRLERFPSNPSTWRFKFCDHHIGSSPSAEELLIRFDYLEFPHKVTFLGRKFLKISSGIILSECLKKGRVMDGHALYRVSLRYFDATDWLAGKPLRKPRIWALQSALS